MQGHQRLTHSGENGVHLSDKKTLLTTLLHSGRSNERQSVGLDQRQFLTLLRRKTNEIYKISEVST